MIDFDRLCEVRAAIQQEVAEEFNGDPAAWSAAQGFDHDDLMRWTVADVVEHYAQGGGWMEPQAWLHVGVQIGLRLGRTAAAA